MFIPNYLSVRIDDYSGNVDGNCVVSLNEYDRGSFGSRFFINAGETMYIVAFQTSSPYAGDQKTVIDYEKAEFDRDVIRAREIIYPRNSKKQNDVFDIYEPH